MLLWGKTICENPAYPDQGQNKHEKHTNPVMDTAISALHADSNIQVSQDLWIIFEPKTTTGIIFYPGGRVAARAYTPPASYQASVNTDIAFK
jgi:hypothetical protein